MGFFKNLFKKKEKQIEAVEIKLEEIKQQENSDENTCEYCKRSIFGQQKIKTFNGKKFHVKPCWFKLRKDAQAYASGQATIVNK